MALMRTRTPNRVFDLVNGNVFEQFDRLFNEMASNYQAPRTTDYPMDLYETDAHLILEMAVPGFTADNIDLSVEDRQLTIRGSHIEESESEGEERRYWMQGISRSEFTRSLTLPKTVDVDNIEANVVDGVLRLSMPKVAEAKVRKIAINAQNQRSIEG
jgi:HSP20 family protein